MFILWPQGTSSNGRKLECTWFSSSQSLSQLHMKLIPFSKVSSRIPLQSGLSIAIEALLGELTGI